MFLRFAFSVMDSVKLRQNRVNDGIFTRIRKSSVEVQNSSITFNKFEISLLAAALRNVSSNGLS